MSFFRKVARDFARDIQVIINGEGDKKSSKPKRQRYDPSKRKRKKRGAFFRRLKKTYGDKASSLNTETQRDKGDRARTGDNRQHARLSKTNKTVCGLPNTGLDWTVENFREQMENPSRDGKLCRRCRSLLTRRPNVQRDFAGELRTLSLQALGRLLNRAYRNGDDVKAHAIEREIDRRTKGAMLSRYSRRR